MLLENDASLFYQVIIPSISSIASVFVIGWKIKDALCKQLNDAIVDFRVHVGISNKALVELQETKDMLTNVILKNNLKS